MGYVPRLRKGQQTQCNEFAHQLKLFEGLQVPRANPFKLPLGMWAGPLTYLYYGPLPLHLTVVIIISTKPFTRAR